MPNFFIDRPIFAWVVALFICLVGAISIPLLAVAQYPIIAPPSISISTSYPGASPENLYNSVTRLIEEELNGAANILNFESTSDSLGQVEIIANFKPGTDTSQASVEVQNRLKRVEARLPRAVIQQGILVEEASSAVLQIITLNSTDGSLDEVGLGDFMIRNVLGEVRRIPGVGRATLYSTERSLRIWIDPAKLVGYGLSADDVNKAITAQNAQVASGSIGAEPSTDTQKISAQVLVKGQLSSPDEFGAIILRANPDGSTVRLRDVARIEIGGLSYQFNTRLDGKPTAGLSVLLSPKGNALATASAVEAKMKELSRFFPANISYEIPYNITPVVKASIEKVLMTLVEAVVLVFIVMFLFLQNIRYTIIPTIVVPVALLGACATLMIAGFSINMLTMFGMVLAVGILVDDAIVVVENVERIMAEEGLPPKEATKKAMSQITGAIIGITLVLMAVFVPMAFFPGSVGIIYRQFSVTMVAAIAFSALLALSLTPALCATLLKPVEKGHGHARKGVFGAFNRVLDRSRAGYVTTVQAGLKRTGRLMLIYLVLFAGVAYGFVRLPGGFLPVDDQGFITTDVQTPSESSYARTEAAVEQVEKYLKNRAGIENVTFLTGFSFLGQGMNTAQAFITLKDWSERGAKDSAAAIVADINRDLSSTIRDARISALQPPPIDNLGNSSGFSFRLQDRGQKGYAALIAASDRLIAEANASPVLQKVYVEGLPPAPQVNLMIDREKAGAFGLTFEDINNTISTNLGSNYINDFPNRGRMQRVIVQADKTSRMNADDILNYNVKNSRGQLVPFSAFATIEWSKGPTQIAGFNYYPAVRISGEAKPGFTSGDAIAEMERLADKLPRGFGYEWTGQSLQEKLSGSQAPFLLALSVLVVFLLLAALYESWTIPLAVLLTIPLGILGAVVAATMRGLSNDVYFTVGLITIIGLAAKDAILIIEFAKDLRAQGKPLVEATIEACSLRFRPILMTGLAFVCGVLPMSIATGAGGASQQALGTSVMGGMIAVVILALLLVPVFFVSVQRVLAGDREKAPANAEVYGPPAPARIGH
ncbi:MULTISPECIES: multidrug efflux RND transporter permease subunit [unclassified Bradyrhizobium]|uniref:multidrug efflux RND transporter permease subunit n=1 Tax=unclassified Bradyrhizobium TaxID=2631580 RepID=UPI001BA9CD9C|nr:MULTISPECIES: multidrug efflux RND transporter permease subunit [unclassified Bradyrhizobium]MBR1203474.1 multidrug efflux RND transporter permease subunit [Bradyrhizobium sp. AUGA SZCCT0124]MBR1313137.1 multidrug efflux RND transporter permease subunit [Bradyrhizobium sp. AUGA SZCCT0051]MBR1341495.1 multidrug efflux RND transporter permease subunit [Bradyrhizobium sp. AUGA SZCCT0105]MBR1356567.1 multidrug efflux RND transporter permease subunit [Bradyrhizobium sp. AUGA SZCCT0045]